MDGFEELELDDDDVGDGLLQKAREYINTEILQVPPPFPSVLLHPFLLLRMKVIQMGPRRRRVTACPASGMTPAPR